MSPGEPSNDTFERRVRERFERESAALGPDVERSLRLARHRALDAARQGRRGWLSYVPAGAAVAAVALVAVVTLMRRDEIAVDPTSAIADLDVLATEENLDLFEDLEFYAWLAQEEDVI